MSFINSVVANYATTASDGKTYQVDYYNLDVIISVGYRVKSQRGVQFRIWATARLKDYVEQLDRILSSGGRSLLENPGTISRAQAIEKATAEYRKYQETTIVPVEKAYLETVIELSKEVSEVSKRPNTEKKD